MSVTPFTFSTPLANAFASILVGGPNTTSYTITNASTFAQAVGDASQNGYIGGGDANQLILMLSANTVQPFTAGSGTVPMSGPVPGSGQDAYNSDINTLTTAVSTNSVTPDWMNAFASNLKAQYTNGNLSADSYNSLVALLNQTATLAGIPGFVPQLSSGQNFSNTPQITQKPPVITPPSAANPFQGLFDFFSNAQAGAANTANALSWPWKTTAGIPNWLLVGGGIYLLTRQRGGGTTIIR